MPEPMTCALSRFVEAEPCFNSGPDIYDVIWAIFIGNVMEKNHCFCNRLGALGRQSDES